MKEGYIITQSRETLRSGEANGKVYFKQETIHNTTTKQVNIGLGKNENGGLKYFNGENGSNILEFQIVQ